MFNNSITLHKVDNVGLVLESASDGIFISILHIKLCQSLFLEINFQEGRKLIFKDQKKICIKIHFPW